VIDLGQSEMELHRGTWRSIEHLMAAREVMKISMSMYLYAERGNECSKGMMSTSGGTVDGVRA
jgi:hypothetical protein